ncbi:TnpV protein [Pseudoflavonifractor sp. 524-17]|uniref:TnpV protein n=1 Tax=Pseudoflavonifractor sp. 524-17 TaxID=2304577 RepID=UPI00137A03C7|nr:TnpV protein [Pseudoflavonifractor sp. 524-17]NCE65842.1 TnpV protein [Pseudoflavonifractor sp. 524-17]
MKSLYERMGGTYRQEGDYFVPNLVLPDTGAYPLGKYGRMRRRYLKEHYPALYNTMILNDTLHQHLVEIDQTCHERMEHICAAMAAQEGVTEALKTFDQLAWVERMNGIHNRAEEIVMTELVYTEDGRA